MIKSHTGKSWKKPEISSNVFSHFIYVQKLWMFSNVIVYIAIKTCVENTARRKYKQIFFCTDMFYTDMWVWESYACVERMWFIEKQIGDIENNLMFSCLQTCLMGWLIGKSLLATYLLSLVSIADRAVAISQPPV